MWSIRRYSGAKRIEIMAGIVDILFNAAGGGGSALMPASTVAPVLGSATPLGTVSSTTGTPVRSETVLYVRQVTDSAVAGTISVYLLIVPLP
jgi:hypothetical protein